MMTNRPSELQEVFTVEEIFVSGSPVSTLLLLFSVEHVADDIISGSVDLTLPGGALALVGSSGAVWYGVDDGQQAVTLTGTWPIVGSTPAPTPSTLPLLAIGLLGVLFRHRQRSGAKAIAQG